MAENTGELAQNQPGADEQDILNEDLFDFPSDENFVDDIRLANEADASQDDDIFDFAGHDAILESEGDVGDLSSGTRALETLVDADEALADPAPSADPAPTASADPSIGTADLDEDIFNFDNPVDPDAPDQPQQLTHADLIEKRPPVAEVAPEPAPEPKPAPAPVAQPISAAPAATASSLPPVSEVARQSANEALAVAQAARLAILAQQPAASAPIADTGWNRRMVISVSAAFLLVNASLIFVAGRLGQSLNSALNGVREDLTRSISVAHQADGSARILSPDGQIPQAANPVPAETSGPTALTDVASRELELAHNEIEEGAFPAARRRLYRLLANRDRLIISADVLAESEFLVAESYFAEAKRLDTIVVEAEQ